MTPPLRPESKRYPMSRSPRRPKPATSRRSKDAEGRDDNKVSIRRHSYARNDGCIQWQGRTIVDSDGEKIGKISEIYEDPQYR